jgi:guanylate kinase
MKGKLVIFSAPSGAGKTTIVKRLLKKNLNLEFSISACSRPKRSNEVHGKDYYFFSLEDFKKRIQNDEFVEWEEVYKNHFYGTLKSEISRIRNQGKNVIFDVDVEGGLNLKKAFNKDALAIFIMPPSVHELQKRLIKRATDENEKINIRVEKASSEIKYATKFDKVIINDDLERATQEAEAVVRNFLNL